MWVFNVLLYLCFLFAPAQYAERVSAGASCYGYAAAMGNDQGEQPVCWYDPANTNPGR